jgi:hypothetical protein
VHGHASGDPDPDSGDFAVGLACAVGAKPGATSSFHAIGRDAERTAHADHGALDETHVTHHIERLVERDYRIADELTRAVPGDLPAAVDVDDWRARVADRPVEWAGALARRVNRLVLKEQARVRDLADDPTLVDQALEIPRGGVFDGVRAMPSRANSSSPCTASA